MTFQFWKRWLMAVTSGVIVYGLSLILLPDMARNVFNGLFFSSPETAHLFTEETNVYTVFAHSILGAVLVGWMLTFMCLLTWSFRPDNRPAWNTLAVSVIGWFVIDTGYSLYAGVIAHVLFNCAFLVLFAVPLAATYRHFHTSSHLHKTGV